MSGVLLLNASWEPLRVINIHRAVILILQEKAEIVEAGTGSFRSTDVTIPQPEVIRLKYFVKVPYRSRVPLTNRAVLNRDKYKCAFEGQNKTCTGKATTVDHVQPKSRGGKHEWTNVVGACKRCNSKKSNHLLSEIGWHLPFTPQAPTAKTWIVVGTPEKAEDWNKWLEGAY